MAKKAPTKSQVVAWAKKSTRPNGDCQGFAGNDFTAKFGTFKHGYSSANDALAASKAEGHFHTGNPPSDGRVYWIFYKFPKYGHVMLWIDGLIIGDTSFATEWLNKKKTVGMVPHGHYPYPYLGYSSSNGVNTVPAPVKIVPKPPVVVVPKPPIVVPPVVPTAPALSLSTEQADSLNEAYTIIGKILNK